MFKVFCRSSITGWSNKRFLSRQTQFRVACGKIAAACRNGRETGIQEILMRTAESAAAASAPWSPIILLLACYSVFDFFVPALLGKFIWPGTRSLTFVLLATASCGCVTGQLGALSAWGVIGTRPVLGRWFASLLAALCLVALSERGTALSFDGPIGREFRRVLLILPATLLGVQLPIWAARIGQGYRIVGPQDESPHSQDFTLRDALISVAVIAVSLALPQIGSKEGPHPETVGVLAGCVLGGIAMGLLVVLPCLHIAFLTSAPRRGRRFVISYIAAATLIAASLTISMAGEDALPLVLLCSIGVGAAAFVLHGSFLVLRNDGYALRRIKFAPTGSPT